MPASAFSIEQEPVKIRISEKRKAENIRQVLIAVRLEAKSLFGIIRIITYNYKYLKPYFALKKDFVVR